MGIGQTLVYRWSYRVLEDVARSLFLTSEENRADQIFMQLADYFKGTIMKTNEAEDHSHDGISFINHTFLSSIMRSCLYEYGQ